MEDSNTRDFVEEKTRLLHGRRKSTSFLAVRNAVYQLTCLNDFTCEKIGAGFFAEVYKVRHKTTGEVMVLKMNKNSQNKKQMLAEIQLLNRLSHPNILGFRGSCVHEGQLHALTEYMNGGTLEALLQDHSIPLSWPVRIKMAADIAQGMAYLHSKGVFHRDLTSKNCLLHKYDNGTFKTVVADFGLAAKIKIKQKRRSYTETVGTAYWMAPECLRGNEYCEKADIFSYAIILAEITSRLSADPDFIPRTHDFGVDLKGLHALIDEGCPPTFWEMLQCCAKLNQDDRPNFDQIVITLNKLSITESDMLTTPVKTLASSQSEPVLMLIKTEDTDGNYEFTRESPTTPTSETDLLSSLLEGTSLSVGVEGAGMANVKKRTDFLMHGVMATPTNCSHKPMGSDSGIDPGFNWQKEYPGIENDRSAVNLKLRKVSSPLVSGSPHHCRDPSDSSEISFHLPSPSYAWAPPSSPTPDHKTINEPFIFSQSITGNVSKQSSTESIDENIPVLLTEPTSSCEVGVVNRPILGCSQDCTGFNDYLTSTISAPNLQT